jgi:hypothetical protein
MKRILVFGLLLFGLLIYQPVFSAPPKVGDAFDKLDETVDRTGVSKTEVPAAVGEVVRIILSIVGIMFFVLVLYAGFRWMTARGQEEVATKAKNTLIAAVIGLMVAVGGYGISVLVAGGLFSAIRPVPADGTLSGGTIVTPGGNAENMGCCFDKVGVDTENDLLYVVEGVNNEYWTARVTTQADCEYRGTHVEENDIVIGEGKWEFIQFGGVFNDAEDCQAEYEYRYAVDTF